MEHYEGRIFHEYFATVKVKEDNIDISIAHYESKKTFSIELNESSLSSFSHVGKNPKKVISSICMAAFKEAEKSYDSNKSVKTNTFTFSLSFDGDCMILHFSRLDPNGFDDPISWEMELSKQNIPFEQSILCELNMLRESRTMQSISTIAHTGSFTNEAIRCSINVPRGTYVITASLLCKDTANSQSFWAYYDITVNGASVLQTNTGHYLSAQGSSYYPCPITLHTVTPHPIEGKIEFTTSPWSNTQYGSLVLTVTPTRIQ